MFKNAKTQKWITVVTAILCVLSMLVGTMAYFTDRESASTKAKAGFMDMVFEDTSLAANSNNEFAIDKVWESQAIVADGGIINPGDYFDMSYTLTNEGNKSMDIRQKLTLFSSTELTEGAEEYQLTITGGNDSTKVTGALSDDKMSITYDLADITLNGSVETEEGATDGVYTIRLDFAREAGNSFMNSIVAVNTDIQAKQHRNTTDDDWADWGSYTTDYEIWHTVEATDSINPNLLNSDGSMVKVSDETPEIVGLTTKTYYVDGTVDTKVITDSDVTTGENVSATDRVAVSSKSDASLGGIVYSEPGTYTMSPENMGSNDITSVSVGFTFDPSAGIPKPASCGVEGHYEGDGKTHGIELETVGMGPDGEGFVRQTPDGIYCYSNHTYTCECEYWVVPEGCTYERNGTIYNAGEALPDCLITPRGGDILRDGEYEYHYERFYEYDGDEMYWWRQGKQKGWGVRVIDNTKTSYGEIKSSIRGYPVTMMENTFQGCESLVTAPEIPNTVLDMDRAFAGCTSLETAPVIPNGVTSMWQTFLSCKSLTAAPVIPNSVENMRATFSGCSALATAPVIPSSVKDISMTFCYCSSLSGTVTINTDPDIYYSCFMDTEKSIVITGSCSEETKANLAKTANNKNVTYQ